MTTFSTDQWVILGLVFLLGFLIGAWLTSGGRRKWKTRHEAEVSERRALEQRLKERETHFAAQEKTWREQDAQREAALRSRPVVEERREPFVEERLRDRHPGEHRETFIDNRTPDRQLDGSRETFSDNRSHGRGPNDMDHDGIPDRYDRRPLDDRR